MNNKPTDQRYTAAPAPMPYLRFTGEAYHRAKNRCANVKYRYITCGLTFNFRSLDELIAAIGMRPQHHKLALINHNGNFEAGNVVWKCDAKIPYVTLHATNLPVKPEPIAKPDAKPDAKPNPILRTMYLPSGLKDIYWLT